MDKEFKSALKVFIICVVVLLAIQWHAYHHIDQVPDFLSCTIVENRDGKYSSLLHWIVGTATVVGLWLYWAVHESN